MNTTISKIKQNIQILESASQYYQSIGKNTFSEEIEEEIKSLKEDIPNIVLKQACEAAGLDDVTLIPDYIKELKRYIDYTDRKRGTCSHKANYTNASFTYQKSIATYETACGYKFDIEKHDEMPTYCPKCGLVTMRYTDSI